MLPECPDDLKYILPYLQRASELKVRDPIAAYYCGFYAANLAIQKGYPKNQANEAYLMALLDDLGAVLYQDFILCSNTPTSKRRH